MAPFDQSEEYVVALPQVAPSVDPVLAVLMKARDWLSDPAHWCQNALIIGHDGRECSFSDAPAASCAWGAIVIATGRPGITRDEPYCLVEKLCGEARLQWFNDDITTTHADILALFDRAIASRKAQTS